MSEKLKVRYSRTNAEDFEFENFQLVSKSAPAKVNEIKLKNTFSCCVLQGPKKDLQVLSAGYWFTYPIPYCSTIYEISCSKTSSNASLTCRYEALESGVYSVYCLVQWSDYKVQMSE